MFFSAGARERERDQECGLFEFFFYVLVFYLLQSPLLYDFLSFSVRFSSSPLRRLLMYFFIRRYVISGRSLVLIGTIVYPSICYQWPVTCTNRYYSLPVNMLSVAAHLYQYVLLLVNDKLTYSQYKMVQNARTDCQHGCTNAITNSIINSVTNSVTNSKQRCTKFVTPSITNCKHGCTNSVTNQLYTSVLKSAVQL